MIATTNGSSSGADASLVIAVAVIAALAALAGAIIAAVTAGKRQDRQLTHNADQLRLELVNAHRVASLEDQRRVLDDAAELLLHLESVLTGIDIEDRGHDLIPFGLDELIARARIVEARLAIRMGATMPRLRHFVQR